MAGTSRTFVPPKSLVKKFRLAVLEGRNTPTEFAVNHKLSEERRYILMNAAFSTPQEYKRALERGKLNQTVREIVKTHLFPSTIDKQRFHKRVLSVVLNFSHGNVKPLKTIVRKINAPGGKKFVDLINQHHNTSLQLSSLRASIKPKK